MWLVSSLWQRGIYPWNISDNSGGMRHGRCHLSRIRGASHSGRLCKSILQLTGGYQANSGSRSNGRKGRLSCGGTYPLSAQPAIPVKLRSSPQHVLQRPPDQPLLGKRYQQFPDAFHSHNLASGNLAGLHGAIEDSPDLAHGGIVRPSGTDPVQR